RLRQGPPTRRRVVLQQPERIQSQVRRREPVPDQGLPRQKRGTVRRVFLEGPQTEAERWTLIKSRDTGRSPYGRTVASHSNSSTDQHESTGPSPRQLRN